MKDKEKQIEEMAKEICRYVKGKITPPDIRLIKNENSILLKHSHNYGIAKELYEQGYRKITDSVVLSKEEYQKLKMLEEGHITCEDVLEFVEKARKETAEKILKELWHIKLNTAITLKNDCSREDIENLGKGILTSLRNQLKELAKQFGVEIKE
jgi:hypothetical protein